MKQLRVTLLIVLLLCCIYGAFGQSTSINYYGGFESNLPSYWNIGDQPGGSTLTWATDQFRSLGHSLKITKVATSDSAAWTSDNMVDYWSPQHLANVDILLGAYVMTQNVNTNPVSDDEKWWVSYTFYDSAGVLIGQTKLPIDQSVASSSGWVADTNGIGETILPKNSWKTIIQFVGGKNATGTVWADDFIFTGRNGAWAGQDWNTGVGVPTGWTYWLPPNGGNDGLLTNGFENTVITNEASHSGLYSLKFNLPFDRQPHDGFIGTKRFPLSNIASGINPGDVLRVSVWVKASNLVPDSAALYPTTWACGFTYGFFQGNGNNDGFNSVSGYPIDMQFQFPSVTTFDWTQYTLDVTVPNDPTAKDLEIRLHAYSRFTGTIYFDDLTVEKLEVPQLNDIVGGFESNLPSYWNIGDQPGGSTLTWATDQFRSLGHSLKITKVATSDSAAWTSDNMVDYWSPQHLANVDILLGAYVMTQNVNTNPVSDDEKWWVSYTFYDSAGVLIGQTKLPIDQSVASSSGWVADTNGIGETILPKNSWKTIIQFVGGKNATGTVWADDFIFTGRNGAWAGQDWNTGVGVPTGWTYWLPPNGGNDGLLTNGFENTVITNEASHSGLYSLKFNLPFDRQPHDGFVGTKRFLLNNPSTRISPGAKQVHDISALTNVNPGDVLRISVWVKASNLVPDSAALYPTTWACGFTYGFFQGNGNNDGFNNVSGYPIDMQFQFPSVTTFDWTQYTLDVTVPNDPTAKALEVRLHAYSRFTGTIYFDDLTVEKLAVPTLSSIGGFESNLPSYWNIGDQPGGSTLTWATDQFRSLGHSLKITKVATSDSAAWTSDNMVDYWSPQHLANVDILLGAYVMTQNVNTNPVSDDEKWWVSYTFYDSAGVLIGQTKLPIDQSVASSTGWVADTNGIGETILPKNSWKTIIQFVGGKNATGTVWADDFIFTGRNGAWAGQDWNTGVGVPTGWTYWLPPNGGNDGLLTNGFENTVITNEASHSGLYSLKFNLPFTRQPHDGFVGTKRMPLSTLGGGVKAGDILRISVWVKANSLVPDSAALYPTTWACGFTYGFFTGNGNNDGFNSVSGYPIDAQFQFPAVTLFDWTQYYLDIVVPSDSTAKDLEVRLHPYSRFTGTIYFDDLNVQVIGNITSVKDKNNGLPKTYELADNYPNPFNPTTTIGFGVPHSGETSIVVYNVLGQQVRALVSGNMAAGYHLAVWDGRNDHGTDVQSGIYFYRLSAGNVSIVKKMLYIK